MSDETKQKDFVRSGIRTHAHRSGLRPERSALDLSAILTQYSMRTSGFTPWAIWVAHVYSQKLLTQLFSNKTAG